MPDKRWFLEFCIDNGITGEKTIKVELEEVTDEKSANAAAKKEWKERKHTADRNHVDVNYPRLLRSTALH